MSWLWAQAEGDATKCSRCSANPWSRWPWNVCLELLRTLLHLEGWRTIEEQIFNSNDLILRGPPIFYHTRKIEDMCWASLSVLIVNIPGGAFAICVWSVLIGASRGMWYGSEICHVYLNIVLRIKWQSLDFSFRVVLSTLCSRSSPPTQNTHLH